MAVIWATLAGFVIFIGLLVAVITRTIKDD